MDSRGKLYDYYKNQIIQNEYTQYKELFRDKYREIKKQDCLGCVYQSGSIIRHDCAYEVFDIEKEIERENLVLEALLTLGKITLNDYKIMRLYLPKTKVILFYLIFFKNFLIS